MITVIGAHTRNRAGLHGRVHAYGAAKAAALCAIAAAALCACGTAYASEPPAYVDSARFVQYLDENTALEEVRDGNLDMYYFRISSDRLETQQSRQGLGGYESSGGSYSLLVNPAAPDDAFNPFQDGDVRFALNYLVDRRLIVSELMGGYGMPIISHYGPSDPEYLTVVEDLAAFDFGYKPALADKMIGERLREMGAERSDDNAWVMDSEPVTVTIFIRSDDPVRKSIGEILASELEQIGFEVEREFGDLNKAFVVVYGSDPAGLEWHLYTEGWAKSAFVRYDSTGLAQMYSPWFSSMPGFNDPSYWNYENDRLDNLTQRIYTGDFADSGERASLIKEAVTEGVQESVRIFLASKTDQYVTHESVTGVVNDFGAGLPSRFTPINARLGQPPAEGGELRIGVKQIYQGSWNPVMGFRDAYSTQIGTLLSDPATFKHPYTGETIPVRASWNVTTAGPNGVLDVADDAIIWNPAAHVWERVDPGANATSMVLLKYSLGNWHSGAPMDMFDILHSFYFAKEWGTHTGPDDVTFDTEFTSIIGPSVETVKGIRPVGHDSLEVYVDYWHFDEGEIAQWAAPSVSMPWELIAAMEGVVSDGKASFSRSGAASKGIGWLSVIIPNDANTIQQYLESMRDVGHVPAAAVTLPDVRAGGGHGTGSDNAAAQSPPPSPASRSPQPPALALPDPDPGYYQERYDSAISWIERTQHAMIGNGPFYLDSYSPESRSIRIVSFDDPTYPFGRGSWSDFERAAFPEIVRVDLAGVVQVGDEMSITVTSRNADTVLYFVTGGAGGIVSSGTRDVPADGAGVATITIPGEDTARLTEGANQVRVFALSDSVLMPDIYEVGFLALGSGASGGAGVGVVEAPPMPFEGGGGGVPDADSVDLFASAPDMDGSAGGDPVITSVASALVAATILIALVAYYVRSRRRRSPHASH